MLAPVWRIHRKLMLPAIKTLHKSTEVFQKHSRIFLKYLATKENGVEFDVANETFKYVFNAVLGKKLIKLHYHQYFISIY